MKKWMRRIRAAIVMGFLWVAAWSCAGFVVARMPGFFSDLPFAILFAPFAFVTGILFSGLLVAIERRGALDRMSLSRFAMFGAVIGLLLSAIFPFLREHWREFFVIGPCIAIASAAAAAASLALARRAR